MEELVKYLKSLLGSVAKEQHYDNYKVSVEQVSTGGANYSSYLFRVVISAPGKEDLYLFAKVAAIGEKLREIGNHIYDLESFFYTNLLTIYRQLENKHVSEKDKILTPKFYKYSNEYMKETFLLEDLNARGFLNFDRFKSVTWEQAARSVQELAKLHALSLALSNKDPEEYEKITQSMPANNMDMKALRNFLNAIRGRVLEATKESDKERLSTFTEKIMNDDNLQYLIGPIRKSVLIHGDFRPNNLMYKVEIVPLDFQTLHPGSPVFDLMYFINLGCDAEFCQVYFQAILDHYYSELCKALQKFDVNPEEAYSREDFDYEFKEILPYTLLMGFCILLVITVDEDCAPKDLGNLALDDFAVAPNEHYRTRLRGFIQFYTQMGVF